MVNIAKKLSEENGPEFLRGGLARVHERLVFDLKDAEQTITHDGKRGDATESSWLRVIRSYLPNRYEADTAFVIDSNGKTSEQIDIVIFDPHYIPMLLTREGIRYIPAEAVYAVLEAKPEINKGELEYAGKKAASVRRLKRTSVEIVNAGRVVPARAPFPIISGIIAASVVWSDGFGKTFQKVLTSTALSGDSSIDCGCGLSHGTFDSFEKDARLTFGKADVGLVFFLFRLLNKLQSLGTVPAIDWNAYAEVLR